MKASVSINTRVHEVYSQGVGLSEVCMEWVGWEEVCQDFLVELAGDGSGRWYDGSRRGWVIDQLGEGDRSVLEVHVIAGGRWLVGHGLRLVPDLSRCLRGLTNVAGLY